MIDLMIKVHLFESMFLVCDSIKFFKNPKHIAMNKNRTHLRTAIISETPFVLLFLIIYLSLMRIKVND